ncbi:hypothetical protein F5Y10DRAFT_225050 [Nemania abortiva]|nr:hypothetical protein F5Y10DRAFT_225050 [Nemania abortiva]
MSPTGSKCWILTPSSDYHPNGLLSLGQILTDPGSPESALVQPGDIPPPSETSRSTLRNKVKIESSDEGKADIGLWVTLNARRAAASGAHLSSSAGPVRFTLEINELETEVFKPTTEYTKKVFDARAVSSQTSWWKAQRRIFIVTSVGVAKGAVMSRERSQFHGTAGNVEVSAMGQSQSVNESVSSTSDFVFAYRLHEINYRIWRSGAIARHDRNVDSRERDRIATKHEVLGYKLQDIDEQPFDDGSYEDGTYKVQGDQFVALD